MQELEQALKAAAKKLFNSEAEVELTRPEEQFGDFASNIALQLAKKEAKNPREVAEVLAAEMKNTPGVADVTVAGPGFLNIKLTDEKLVQAIESSNNLLKPLAGQEILVEFGDPNPFKEMHIGHLYSYIVGDAVSSLLETSGATVKRLSYHGDVGLHVAKAIFGLQELDKDNSQGGGADAIDRENFLGKAYAYGAEKYENDESAKSQIDEINQHIYQKDDLAINDLHKKGVDLSFDYFDKVLGLLNIKNDRRYLESQTLSAGKELVEKNTNSVFEQSEGAIVYKGEKVGLHTRVFITSAGLPTYETKDLGLTELKNKDFPSAARSIIITANEQSEYFKVMLAALAEIDKPLADKTSHLSHGFVSLSTGKMSSRTGKVYAAMKLLLEVKDAVHAQYPDSDVRKEITFAAVKYSFLKHRIGSDIVLDIDESIGLEGNSGPYLQYAFARACGILQKANDSNLQPTTSNLESGERSLARKISEYPEVVAKAAADLMPHYICTYLYELAQVFNRFYEANRVVGDPREATRLNLVKAYADVLKNGLDLLNIAAPEQV